LNNKGMILGSFNNVHFEKNEAILSAGDGILFYTDGIIEAKNEQNQMYKLDRLGRFMEKYGHLPVENFIKVFEDKFKAFCGNKPANDDRTLLYVKLK